MTALESVSMTEERRRAFADGLSKAERVLVVVRDELYGGSWDELIEDLRARQDQKPYIFKLNSRIDEDLSRISKLRAFEQEEEINLASLLGGEDGSAEEGIPL
jgi:hypothetical protein